VRHVAEAARQSLNALLLQQNEEQPADEKVIGPMNLGARMVRQHSLHRGNELQSDRVEHVLDDAAAAFARIADLAGDQARVEEPATLIAQLNPRPGEGVEHELDRRWRTFPRHQFAQLGDAFLRDRIDTAVKYRPIKALFAPKVVAEERELHVGGGRDVAHGNAIEAAFREQALGRVQNPIFRAFAVPRAQYAVPVPDLIRRLIN
jgi:hypothetical protein